MRKAPTFVGVYGNAATSTATTKTGSITVAAGDLVLVYGLASDSPMQINTPTGGGVTWTIATSLAGTTGYANTYVWSATFTTAQTFTLTVTGQRSGTSGGNSWTWAAVRFSKHGGIGNKVSSSFNNSSPNLNFAVSGNKSAVLVCSADWNVVDGASRVWRTNAGALTETTYTKDTQQTGYGGVHKDAGAPASYRVGLTAPTGQKYTMSAVEILGVDVPSVSRWTGSTEEQLGEPAGMWNGSALVPVTFTIA